MGDFDDGFTDRTDLTKRENGTVPQGNTVDDYERRVIRFAAMKRERADLDKVEARKKELDEQIYNEGVALGLIQPKRERTPPDAIVKVEDVLSALQEHAPHEGAKELTAKDIEALFPGRNVRSAIAKITKEKLAAVTVRKGARAGGNLFKAFPKKNQEATSNKKR